MQTIRIIKACRLEGVPRPLRRGSIGTFDDRTAERLIAAGSAVPVSRSARTTLDVDPLRARRAVNLGE